MDYNQLREQLRAFSQSHLLAHWETLSATERTSLAAQIESIDFAEIAHLFERGGSAEDASKWIEKAQPPKAIRLSDRQGPIRMAKWEQLGEGALRRGEMGVILVAGGQGTRLGFDAPKGTFSIGPVSGASLFQILLEKVLATGRRFGRNIPLYVMTSRATHKETETYFQQNSYFGLEPKDVQLFEQANMPAVDAATGRVLLADKSNVQLSPDGHGGMLTALVRTGCLDDIRKRGLRYLFYMQVDNPLVELAAPSFLGCHIEAGSEMSTQVVAKERPEDKLGIVVEVENRARMIEYSDLPDELAQKRGPDGALDFWAGSIAVHIFDVGFLHWATETADSLPFHIAKKKVGFLDDDGRQVEPNQPNAFKFERFIFDLMPIAKHPLVYEVDRKRAFAPLKNESGAASDTPEFVRERMVELHREWLHQAGAELPTEAAVEIGPLFALDAAETARKIAPGTPISDRTYLH